MKSFLIATGVAVFLVGVGVWLWNRERRLRTSAEQRQEAAELALQNQIVESQRSKAQLQEKIDGLLVSDRELRTAYDAAKKAAPDARPVSASKLGTGPLQTPPRPAGAPGPCDPGACALNWGDQISIDVTVLELRTQKGNTLVVGTAAAFRDLPEPRTQLAGGPFRSSLSSTSELETRSEPRWGAMGLGVCGTPGCGVGAAVLLPPAHLLGARIETMVGAAAGPGLALLEVGVGGRW